jgi:hypothetical protein
MRSFDSFGEFEAHLLRVVPKIVVGLHLGVREATKAIEAAAKAEIGVYQDGVGTDRGGIGAIPPWAQLAESTERRKEIMGFPLDAPLLATGEFRDSIESQVIGLKGVVGTKDERGVWFELGTPTMPPRAVFAPAAIHLEKKVLRILEEAAASALIGGDWLHPPLSED